MGSTVKKKGLIRRIRGELALKDTFDPGRTEPPPGIGFGHGHPVFQWFDGCAK